jgi:hypothetical protein
MNKFGKPTDEEFLTVAEIIVDILENIFNLSTSTGVKEDTATQSSTHHSSLGTAV